MPTYQGNEPYIFISYAHKDSDRVQPIIEGLQTRGFRVWYDAGIRAGDGWVCTLTEKIEGCCCFLPFLSKAFVCSKNCAREVFYAVETNKLILPVQIEDVELPHDMKFQMSSVQFMFANRYPDTDAFLDALCALEVLAPCRSALHAVGLLGEARRLFGQLQYDEAFDMLTQAAEADCADAQFELAERYHYGKNCAVDLCAAVRWYHRAAQNGHNDAQFELGMCYYSGEGVPRDEEQAFFWMQQGNEQLFAQNMFTLSIVHAINGNDAEAVRLLTISAEAGNAHAQFALGGRYLEGDGVEADYDKGVALLRLAAQQGLADAAAELERLGEPC